LRQINWKWKRNGEISLKSRANLKNKGNLLTKLAKSSVLKEKKLWSIKPNMKVIKLR
jgi:hypothetical protein